MDIVVTHAAPEGLGDSDDPAHWGFPALRELLDVYHPAYLVHGHVHMSYGHEVARELTYNGTRVVNAYERHVIALPDRDCKPQQRGQVIYKTRVSSTWGDD